MRHPHHLPIIGSNLMINQRKCEICGEIVELHDILGDDCKLRKVCAKCLKKYWKIDLDVEEDRIWRERKRLEYERVK